MSDTTDPDPDALAKEAAAARRAWNALERTGGVANITEIARQWGVEPQTVRDYRERHPADGPDPWPEPVAKFGRVELFLVAETARWRATPRKRGPRPRTGAD